MTLSLWCLVGIIANAHGEGFFPDLDYSEMPEKELLRYKGYFVRQLKKVNDRIESITQTKEADDKTREDDEVKQRTTDNLNLQKEVIAKLPECAKGCTKKFVGCQSNWKLEHNDPNAVEVRPLCTNKLDCSDEQCAVTPGGYWYSEDDILALDIPKITVRELKSIFKQYKLPCEMCKKKQDYKKVLRAYKKKLQQDRKKKRQEQSTKRKQRKAKQQYDTKKKDDNQRPDTTKKQQGDKKPETSKGEKTEKKTQKSTDEKKSPKANKEKKKTEKEPKKSTDEKKPSKASKEKKKTSKKPEKTKKKTKTDKNTDKRGWRKVEVPGKRKGRGDESEDVEEEIDLDAMEEEEADHSEL